MSNPIIKVNNLSKRYRIGAVSPGYKTFREAITQAVTAPFRNFSRLRKLTEFKNGDESDVIWALKDVSFEVEEGEVLGIIGRNGAGKTTILKILSRITEPSAGFVEMKGRVSSLLEVGTGFHPELTGRENVFLNGAILGMRKREIESKFDAIVSFAEIEKFIDTPVKHFSSGMYVRLAFAVAAHLEPEILLVDEVLAVGDAAFQKKCLGKMGDIARGGRTVLFVSHNMAAVQQLCPRTILLEHGHVVEDAPTQKVISDYFSTASGLSGGDMDVSAPALRRNSLPDSRFRWTRVTILNRAGKATATLALGEPFELVLQGLAEAELPDVRAGFSIDSILGVPIFNSFQIDNGLSSSIPAGETRFYINIDPNLLAPGLYTIGLGASGSSVIDWLPTTLQFRVSDVGIKDTDEWRSYSGGMIRYPCKWEKD